MGFYRIAQPIQFIDKVNPEKSRITPFSGTGQIVRIFSGYPNSDAWSDETLMEICEGADILWTTMIYDREEMVKMLNLRKWSGARWVVDIDDDLYSIPVDNPGKESAESLRSEGELCLSIADGVTVSTPRLKDVYKHLNQNIYINPNGQDLRFWDKLVKSLPLGKSRKLRLGWRGAMGHAADVSLLGPALEALQKEYNIELVTLGHPPSFKTEHHDWVGCLDFPKTLANLRLDIALVPLIDSPYNRSKSNIAIQEFSMLKVPCVASPVENQADIKGVLYASSNHSWYEQIEQLIKSAELRKKNGLATHNYVKHHYDMKKLTTPLLAWFGQLKLRDLPAPR